MSIFVIVLTISFQINNKYCNNYNVKSIKLRWNPNFDYLMKSSFSQHLF